MNRLTQLPQPRTLEELAETCERHAKNYRANIWDCADCQDCSDAEVAQFQMNVAQWTELANDIREMIYRMDVPARKREQLEKEGKIKPSTNGGGLFDICGKCGEAAHRHPYRNCDEWVQNGS